MSRRSDELVMSQTSRNIFKAIEETARTSDHIIQAISSVGRSLHGVWTPTYSRNSLSLGNMWFRLPHRS